MRGTRRALLVGVAFLTSAILGACDRSGGPDAAEEVAVPAGEEGAMDGLTREEISRQVQPLSPAKAHDMGIIDTTQRIENPPPGSKVIPGTGREVGPGDTL